MLSHLLTKPTDRSDKKSETKAKKDAKDAATAAHASPTTAHSVKILPAEIVQKSDLLPAIVKSIASDFLADKNAPRYLVTCRGLYHVGKDFIKNECKLAHHAIFNPTPENRAELIAMLEAKPELLKTKIRYSKDQSGRVFENKTVFQLICGARDEAYYLAMWPAFLRLCNNDKDAAMAEMERQRLEMRGNPGEEKKKEAESKRLLKEILKPVIAAIGAEQFNHGQDDKGRWKLNPDTTLPAINRFREEYKKIQSSEGMHFRYNTFAEALAQNAAAVPGWCYDDKKCALFGDAVLSTIEADFPVNDACKAAQGLHYLHRDNEPEQCAHSLMLRNGGDNFYKIVRGPSQLFDLSGRYVDISFGRREGSGRDLDMLLAGLKRSPIDQFSILMSNKNITFSEPVQPTSSRSQSPSLRPI